MMRFKPVSKICNQMRWCGNLLDTGLCVLYFELQAKWVITRTLFRLVTYGILTHIHCSCLQLMSLWSARLEWSLCPLIAKTSKMSKPVTSFTLNFLCRVLKAFHMGWISTLWASLFVLIYICRVKTLLVMTWYLLISLPAFLWLGCLDLTNGFLFSCFPDERSLCWYPIRLICTACGLPATPLVCLAVAFELSILFTGCLTLLAGKFSKSTLPSFMVLDTKSPLGKKNQSISWCRILAVSGGYLARLMCSCTTLYHSSTLLLPCLKLVRRSKWALTSFDCGLQNSSNFPQIVSKLSSSADKHNDTYWSIPKSPLQAITFLHFCCSGSAASSHSRMFSHFKCHLKNLWYRASLTIQSILGPYMCGMNMFGITCCAIDGWKETSGSGSWLELDTSS